MTAAIDRFSGDHAFLSNFHPSVVVFDGDEYPTVEHAFQAAKTLDVKEREHIRTSPTPSQAKRRGRSVLLRRDWEEVKIDVMRRILQSKFTAHNELGQQLAATGDAMLIEGNNWNDRFWGVDNRSGKGHNWLGRLLMDRRSELKTELGGGWRERRQQRTDRDRGEG